MVPWRAAVSRNIICFVQPESYIQILFNKLFPYFPLNMFKVKPLNSCFKHDGCSAHMADPWESTSCLWILGMVLTWASGLSEDRKCCTALYQQMFHSLQWCSSLEPVTFHQYHAFWEQFLSSLRVTPYLVWLFFLNHVNSFKIHYYCGAAGEYIWESPPQEHLVSRHLWVRWARENPL